MRALFLLLLLLLPALAAPPAVPRPPKPPKLVPSSLLVPLGERRTAKWVDGSAEAEVSVGDPNVAGVEVNGRTLVVTGLASGDTQIVVAVGDHMLTLPVSVRPRAARLPETLDLSVTGDKLDLKAALERVLYDKGALHARARLYVTADPKFANGGTFTINVSADGPDLLPTSGKIKLTLARPTLDLVPAETLALSNRPEKITGTGWLLDRVLPAAAPTRLLYHHRNVPGEPERSLEVVVTNPGPTPARVHVVLASVGPSQDEIYAGHLAAARFLSRVGGREGVVLRLAPGQKMVIDRLALKSGQTVSGMGLLTPLEGPPLRLQLRVVSETEAFTDELPVSETEGRTARGLFPPMVEATYSNHAGGKYTYINLGDEPFVTDAQTSERSPGNFGTVYRIRLVLTNPTPEPQEVNLGFQGRGGPARGLVFVDDRLVETAMAGQTPLPLAKWTLEPGEKREVYLETFPQSGSNYPVSLVVSSKFAGVQDAPPAAGEAPAQPRFIP